MGEPLLRNCPRQCGPLFGKRSSGLSVSIQFGPAIRAPSGLPQPAAGVFVSGDDAENEWRHRPLSLRVRSSGSTKPEDTQPLSPFFGIYTGSRHSTLVLVLQPESA